MKQNNLNPLSILLPAAQAPFFISAFLAIRGMSKFPVESFTTGGALWFTDLTLADPYYILPVLATGSILVMVYVSLRIKQLKKFFL
jgi:YidC/Oxa1 family membrane protein insertase